LRVLVIGVGNPAPTFILRRMLALSTAGVQITMVIHHDQKVEMPGVQFLRIGGHLSIGKQIGLLMNALVHPFQFSKLMNLRGELSFSQRIRWGIKYLSLSQLQPPSIVHFQWLASVHEFQWLRHYFNCPFVGSARGSQVTVYPITRSGFREHVKTSIQSTDYIHCVSEDIARACEKLGARREKLFINYNGIDLTKFHPGTKHKTDSTFTLISVGTLMWRKGFMYQLLILKKLVDRNKNVRLLIVGGGPDLEGLKYTTAALQLQDHVTFTGNKSEGEVRSLLAESDVYLSTSAAEGLANSVVEAMACGIPVIAFDCEGMKEVIEDAVTGYIVEWGDIDRCIEHILTLTDDATLLLQMGNESHSSIERKFDQNYWTQQMIQKYNEVTNR